MFQLLIELFLLSINISLSHLNEYLCPIDAYGWTLFDNKTEEIYQWIYDKKTEEFTQEFSSIEISDNYNIICFDIHQKMYQAILINKNQFSLNWLCNYEKNEGEIQIKSWIFNQRYSPKNLYLQIKDYYRIKLSQTEINKKISIDLNIIKEILKNLSLIKTYQTIFYELILDYGEKHHLIPIQLRSIFEQKFYILPIYSNHKNDTYIDIDCLSTENIEIESIIWFNFTTQIYSFNSKIYLQYSQLISSQLSCVIDNCFTRIITHIYPEYF